MKINCFHDSDVKYYGADYFESAFGMFFVLIDRVNSQAILWPLVAARGTSITCLLLLVLIRGEFHVPEKNQLGLMALVGFFDAAGNTFFALTTAWVAWTYQSFFPPNIPPPPYNGISGHENAAIRLQNE